jgi:hypothetical protein
LYFIVFYPIAVRPIEVGWLVDEDVPNAIPPSGYRIGGKVQVVLAAAKSIDQRERLVATER